MRKTPAIIQEILDDIFSEEVEEVEEFEAVYMEDNGEDYLDENDEEDVEEATSDEEDPRLYWCICGGDGDGELILCANARCLYKKFHYECAGEPMSDWLCPNCRKPPKKLPMKNYFIR